MPDLVICYELQLALGWGSRPSSLVSEGFHLAAEAVNGWAPYNSCCGHPSPPAAAVESLSFGE